MNYEKNIHEKVFEEENKIKRHYCSRHYKNERSTLRI